MCSKYFHVQEMKERLYVFCSNAQKPSTAQAHTHSHKLNTLSQEIRQLTGAESGGEPCVRHRRVVSRDGGRSPGWYRHPLPHGCFLSQPAAHGGHHARLSHSGLTGADTVTRSVLQSPRFPGKGGFKALHLSEGSVLENKVRCTSGRLGPGQFHTVREVGGEPARFQPGACTLPTRYLFSSQITPAALTFFKELSDTGS